MWLIACSFWALNISYKWKYLTVYNCIMYLFCFFGILWPVAPWVPGISGLSSVSHHSLPLSMAVRERYGPFYFLLVFFLNVSLRTATSFYVFLPLLCWAICTSKQLSEEGWNLENGTEFKKPVNRHNCALNPARSINLLPRRLYTWPG